MREIRRKFIHIAFGSTFLFTLIIAGFFNTMALIAAALVLGSIVSFLIFKGVKIPLLSRMVENVEREHEKEFPGKAALLFFAGSLAIMILFYGKIDIVLGSWIVLTFGDGTAALIGKHFGKIKLTKNRSLEGTLIGTTIAFILLQFLFPIPKALIAAITGMAAEFLPLEDNLTIPIVTAITLSFL